MITHGTASVETQDDGDTLVIGGLKGEPHDVVALLTQIKALGRPIRGFVSFGDDWEKLAMLYINLGAVPVGFVMEYPKEK